MNIIFKALDYSWITLLQMVTVYKPQPVMQLIPSNHHIDFLQRIKKAGLVIGLKQRPLKQLKRY